MSNSGYALHSLRPCPNGGLKSCEECEIEKLALTMLDCLDYEDLSFREKILLRKHGYFLEKDGKELEGLDDNGLRIDGN